MDLYGQARSILDQLSTAARKKAGDHDSERKCSLCAGVPQIVEEILYNLCDNAVAYNRPGGTVTVTVEDTPEGAR